MPIVGSTDYIVERKWRRLIHFLTKLP